jgi:hypothetical protein
MKNLVLALALSWPGLALAQQAAQTTSPSADPSRLTSEQLFREVANLKANIDQQLASIIKNAEEFKTNLVRFPTEVDQKITQMEALEAAIVKGETARMDGQFAGIALQFKERDVRTDLLAASLKDALNKAAIASKIAVDAALQAQEKAFTTQNANFAASLTDLKTTFGKLIDNQTLLLATNSKSLDDKIAALKDDTTRAIGAVKDTANATDARSHGWGDSWGVMLGGGAFLLALGTFVVMLFRGRVVYATVPRDG